MRAGMIGRWVGRAVVVAALGTGLLAVTGAAASAGISVSQGAAVQSGFEWN